jgi:hypothetical protein
MAMITPEQVCEHLGFYFAGGQAEYLEKGVWNNLSGCLRQDPFRWREPDPLRNGERGRNNFPPATRRRDGQPSTQP